MVRIKRGVTKRRAHKKIISSNKGYERPRSKLIRAAANAYWKAGEEAFAGRHIRKRQMRQKWIVRLGAAAKKHGLSYSSLIKKLAEKKVLLNRKMLSEIAIRYPQAFEKVIEAVK